MSSNTSRLAVAIAVTPLAMLLAFAAISEHGGGASTILGVLVLGALAGRLAWSSTRAWRTGTWSRRVGGWAIPAAATFAVLPIVIVGLRARGAFAPHDAELASWILQPWALAGLGASALVFGVAMVQARPTAAATPLLPRVRRDWLTVAGIVVALAAFFAEMVRDTAFAEPGSIVEAQRELPALRAEAALRPRNAHVRWLLGFAESFTADTDRSLSDLRAAERLDPTDPAPHNTIGWIHLVRHDYDRAIPELKQAVSLDADYTSALENLGYAYLETRRNREATDAFRRVTRLDPTNAYALRECARALYRDGQWAQAMVYARRAVAADTTDADAHALLGFLSRSRADFAGARREYAKAIALEPRNGRLWGELALTTALMGQRDSSLAQLARAEALEPGLVAKDPRLAAVQRGLHPSSAAIEPTLAGTPR